MSSPKSRGRPGRQTAGWSLPARDQVPRAAEPVRVSRQLRVLHDPAASRRVIDEGRKLHARDDPHLRRGVRVGDLAGEADEHEEVLLSRLPHIVDGPRILAGQPLDVDGDGIACLTNDDEIDDFLLPSVSIASRPSRCRTDNTWNSDARLVLYFASDMTADLQWAGISRLLEQALLFRSAERSTDRGGA